MAELLIKAEGETDPYFGSKPDERPIAEHISKGVVNLDKTMGPTSMKSIHGLKGFSMLRKQATVERSTPGSRVYFQ